MDEPSPMNTNAMSSEEIDATAGQWLARLDRADVTAEELTAFEAWRDADARHAAAFARLEAVWGRLDRLQSLRPPSTEIADPDFLKSESRVPARWTGARGAIWKYTAAAATVLLAIGVWFAYQTVTSAPKHYVTDIGGFQRVVLGDGSVVELNTSTELRIHLRPDARAVELLRGEASFQVMHDPTRPFIVTAGDTAVRALGTQFSVRRRDQSVEVLVTEGKVAVGPPDVITERGPETPPSLPVLKAGQGAVATRAGLEVQSVPPEVAERRLSWQSGMLLFDGNSLAEAVDEFNRYNPRQLEVADRELAALTIGGYFKATNLDAFVAVLEARFGVHATREDDRVILTRATEATSIYHLPET